MRARRFGATAGAGVRAAAWLACGILLCAASCAYFNTFYNAKGEFKKGEEERRNSLTGSGGEANYQKAIEKCQSLLRYYSKSKYCDDALFMIGMSRFYRAEYVQSRASFEDLMERFPKSEYIERSLYWAGLAALKQGDTSGATKMFGRLAKEYPDSKLNVEALFRAAEGQLDSRDYEQARTDLRAFIAAHPKSEFADGAALRIARTYYEEKRYDEAAQEYARVLQRNPKPDVRYEAELRSALAVRAKAEEVLSNPALQRVLRERTAAAARQSLLNGGVTPKRPKGKASNFAGPSATQVAADSAAIAEADSTAAQMTSDEEAQMKVADQQVDQVLERLLSLRKAASKLGRQVEHDIEIAVTRALTGNADAAVADLDQIARVQPHTDLAARARYEIGEIYRRQGQFTKARGAYDESVREKAPSAVSDEAKRKSTAIAARTASAEKLAGAKVLLRRWQDAKAHGPPFGAVAKDAHAGPVAAPDIAATDTTGTGSASVVAGAHTGAGNAPSHNAAGAPGATKAANDSVAAWIKLQSDFEAMAVEQMHVAEVDLLDLDLPLVALREFERVLSDYAGSLQEPRAAFAIAWIHDRRLRDPERARAAYEKLAHDYEGTPQAREAQARLDHWDDPPPRPEVEKPY